MKKHGRLEGHKTPSDDRETVESNFVCGFCGKRFAESYVRRHQRTQHPETFDMNHLCEYSGCGFKADNARSLNIHRASHTKMTETHEEEPGTFIAYRPENSVSIKRQRQRKPAPQAPCSSQSNEPFDMSEIQRSLPQTTSYPAPVDPTGAWLPPQRDLTQEERDRRHFIRAGAAFVAAAEAHRTEEAGRFPEHHLDPFTIMGSGEPLLSDTGDHNYPVYGRPETLQMIVRPAEVERSQAPRLDLGPADATSQRKRGGGDSRKDRHPKKKR